MPKRPWCCPEPRCVPVYQVKDSDYADITKAFRPIWEKLDHRHLNEIRGLENPTSEEIAVWIWRKLKPKLPLLTEVVVAETCTARAVYRGE